MTDHPTVDVSILPVTRDNWRALLSLAVSAEQARFVSGYAPIAAIMLAKAYVGPGALTWRPYAIYERGVPVGMVELASDDDSEDRYWVYHFFIDRAHQRRGLGAAAMAGFIELIQREHPRCRRISLTVHPENHLAQRLYERLGFLRTGGEQDGEPVFVLEVA